MGSDVATARAPVSNSTPTQLEPADRAQCQALRPNKSWSPFNLGPANVNPTTGEKTGGSRRDDRRWRCRVPPVCIVEEIEPDEHGRRGEMSLCGDCFVQLCLQDPGRAQLKEDLRK
jgi:hypothetical protein